MIKKSIWLTTITATFLLDGLFKAALAVSFTVGTNFVGTTLDTAPQKYVPPNGEAAVGPNDLVEFLNGAYAVYDKSTGILESNRLSLNQFYQQAGIANPNNPVDTRILYDASSGHFFALARDSSGQNFELAVSNDSNPLDGFKAYSYQATNKAGTSVDFPTIGLSQDGVYIAGSVVGDSVARSSIISIDKQSLIDGNPIVASFLNNNAAVAGFVIQPASQPGTPSVPEKEYLLSNPINDTTNAFLQKSYLIGPPSNPVLQTYANPLPGETVNNYFVSVNPYPDPEPAKQPNGDNTILTGDARLSSSVILYNGLLWGTQNVYNPSTGNDAIRWFAVDPNATPTGSNDFPGIVYQGLISDPCLDFYYGSIAISPSGNIVMGFTGSGGLPSNSNVPSFCTGQYASSYDVVGSINGTGMPTFGTPFVTGQGAGNYHIDFGGGNRWGDYSSTTLDPVDPNIVWTSQQIATNVNGSIVWGIQNTEIKFNNTTEIPESNLNPGLFTLAGLAIFSRFKRKKE